MSSQIKQNQLDVLVIGGGNAALSAALMAREAGASVMILEAAQKNGVVAILLIRVTFARCMMLRKMS